MSISSVVSRNGYVGTGSASTYSFTFKIANASDLRVMTRDLSGVEKRLTINTEYTVSGVGVKQGGSITLTAGPLASGVVLVIRRVKPLVQNTDIRNQGDFYPEVIEDEFDYLTTLDQQQQDHLDRAVTLPQTFTSADFNPVLPTNIVGAGSVVLATNSTGTALTKGPTLSDISTAISLVPTVTSAVTTTAAAVTATAASAVQAANSATTASGYASQAQTYLNQSITQAQSATSSAQSASQSVTDAATQVATAQAWASKPTGTVDGTEYSAKYYANQVSTSLASKVSKAGDTMSGDLALGAILRLSQEVNSALSGSDVTLSPTKSNYKYTGAITSIKAINPPNTPDGTLLVLTNGTGATVTVKNQAGVNSFITGTGADLAIGVDQTLLVSFDTQAALWRVVGGTGSGGGSLPNGGTTGQVLAKTTPTNGDATWYTLDKTSVGLSNVDNTADSVKNVATAVTAGNVTGVVGFANGGTNATSQQAALNSLAGTQAAGSYLRSDGTNTMLSTIQPADVPTLNQNTTGNAATATSAVSVSGVVGIANGGTGATSQQGALNNLAGPQTAGRYLRSDGTNIVQSSIQAADVPTLNQNTTGNAATATTANTANTATTATNVTGTVAIANGGTGQTTRQAALNALSGTQAAGSYLRSDGTNTSLSTLQTADLNGTLPIAKGGTGATTQAAALTALTGTQTAGYYLRSDGTNSTLAQIQPSDIPNFYSVVNFAGPGTFENSVEGWFNFNDTSAYVDGTGGTATAGGVQLSGVNTTMLGTNNLAWGPGGQAYQGFSKNVVIPGSYQGRILELAFDCIAYTPLSYNDGDLKVIFYDVDHSVILNPIEGDTIRRSLTPFRHRAKVQLPAGYSATSMNIRVSIYQTTTNVAYSYFYLDNLTFGPQLTTTGFAASDLVSVGVNIITATTTAPTKGTTTNDIVRYRRDGDHAHIKGEYKQTVAGAPGSGDYLFQLPNGLSFDANKVTFFTAIPAPSADYSAQIGLGSISVHQGNIAATGVVIPYDSTRFRLAAVTATNGAAYMVGQNLGSMGTATVAVTYDFMAPIAGWSSSVIASSDAGDGRLVAASLKVSTAGSTAATANSPIIFPVVALDTHGAYNSTTGVYTIPASGSYEFAASEFYAAGTAMYVGVYKNGTWLGTLAQLQNTTITGSSVIEPCVAGDLITFRSPQAGTFSYSVNTYWPKVSIKRLNTGNQQIGAEVTIAASYYISAASFAASTTVPVNFDAKEYDSHTAVTTSATAWIFKAPAPGLYEIAGQLQNSSGAAGSTWLMLYKNGVAYKPIAYLAANGMNPNARVKLLAGEYIDIRPSVGQTFSGGTLANPSTSMISIERVGNF